jgi:hypothetical protein
MQTCITSQSAELPRQTRAGSCAPGHTSDLEQQLEWTPDIIASLAEAGTVHNFAQMVLAHPECEATAPHTKELRWLVSSPCACIGEL